jgi:hypothetical protein
MKQAKLPKHARETHTSGAKFGMGTYRGTGIRQPIGKMIDTYMTDTSQKHGKSTALKSLA